ncbi:MAG: hypothetical protein AAGF06_03770, partial [Pseudomonadota bacterium]
VTADQLQEYLSTSTASSVIDPNNDKRLKGWFLTLSRAEKVLNPSITANGTVLFATFKPASRNQLLSPDDGCLDDQGTNRLYLMNVSTGFNPVSAKPWTINGDLRTSIPLNQGGIAPTPQITPIRTPGPGPRPKDECIVRVGLEAVNGQGTSGLCPTDDNLLDKIRFWLED